LVEQAIQNNARVTLDQENARVSRDGMLTFIKTEGRFKNFLFQVSQRKSNYFFRTVTGNNQLLL
jgi:hypothetical protein